MVVTIRCKLLQCFGVPVTLSCVYTVLAKKKFTFLHCKTIVLRNYPYCFCKRCVCTKLKRNANFSFC